MNNEVYEQYGQETLAIRIQNQRSGDSEHSVPLFLTSSFVFGDAEEGRARFADELPGNIYSRFSNPNTNEFVEKLCALESAEDGLATATGMSAIFVSLAGLLKTGDHILVSQSVFGSTVQIVTQLLPRWGITYDFVEINSEQDWESKRKKNTRLFFLETPSNPGLDLADLGSVSGFCKKNNLLLLVDNCFATPYLQKPVEYGADLVIHSATKWIDGQGRVLGGAVVGPKDLIKDLRFFARHTGPALSPFNAWVLSKSLETLAVRMDRHCQNALEVAQFLEENSAVEWVKYPFLPSHPQYDLARKQLKLGGGIVCFALKGGQERVFKMVEQVDWFSYTANLGDTRTILTHPASTTHSKLTEEARLKVGITPGLVRLSVGLEAVEDIKRELERILRLAQG